jgi:ElaB/YqjD/DUF883 family membrane-anchored ribosome-binding protein
LFIYILIYFLLSVYLIILDQNFNKMGVFSSLKKLFFAGESVAKSAVEKSADFVKETAGDAFEKAKDMAEEASVAVGSKTAGLKESIIETASKGFEKASDIAGEIVEKTKEVAADVSHAVEQKVEEISQNETVKKAADFTENLGDKVLDAGEQFMDKTKSVTEQVGSIVLEKGADLTEKAKGLSESIGSKVLEAKDDLVVKAKEAAQKFETKFEELKDTAVKAEAEEAAKPKQEFSDKTLDAGPSLLEDKDDFFSKAAKYADGKYDAFTDKVDNIVDEIKSVTGVDDKPTLELPKDDSPKA